MPFGVAIFNTLVRSPAHLLKKHMAHVHDCVQHLVPFLEAVYAQQWKTAEQHFLKIQSLEKQADSIKQNLRSHLPHKLFLPLISRFDILDLLTIQDQIANTSEDIAGLVYGRKMVFPDVIHRRYQQLLLHGVKAAKQANHAIIELNELFKTVFSRHEFGKVQQLIALLDNIEHETDHIEVTVRTQLFEIEQDLPPVHVMFLYQVIELTGALADYAEQIGKRLDLLLAK